MIIIDPPSPSASRAQWQEFLNELREQQDMATNMNDMLQIRHYIGVAEQMLSRGQMNGVRSV